MIMEELTTAINGFQKGRQASYPTGYINIRRRGVDLNRIRMLTVAIELYERAEKQREMIEKLKQL